MQIINTEKEDYHLHSSNFSDGLNSIDEITAFAGTLGMRKIVITDHSQATLDKFNFARRTFRSIIKRWRNVHNSVDVSFGVEADLLNEQGDICSEIDGHEGEFIVLSYHREVYRSPASTVATGFLRAIEKYRAKINLVGHVCEGISSEAAAQVIGAANKYQVPLELNAKYYLGNPEAWKVLLDNTERFYINSDAHTLWELKTRRADARALLERSGYLVGNS